MKKNEHQVPAAIIQTPLTDAMPAIVLPSGERVVPIEEARKVERRLMVLIEEVRRTLKEESHLADGDQCTLLRLKRAYQQETGTKEV